MNMKQQVRWTSQNENWIQWSNKVSGFILRWHKLSQVKKMKKKIPKEIQYFYFLET